LVDDLVSLDVNRLAFGVDLGQSSNDADGVAAFPEGMGSDDLHQISETGSQSIQSNSAAVSEGELLSGSGGGLVGVDLSVFDGITGV